MSLSNRGPLSEATDRLAPCTFNQLKYRGLYPIMFQYGASVAEGCSALNQHWVFDMDSRANRLASVADSDTSLIQERSRNPEI